MTRPEIEQPIFGSIWALCVIAAFGWRKPRRIAAGALFLASALFAVAPVGDFARWGFAWDAQRAVDVALLALALICAAVAPRVWS